MRAIVLISPSSDELSSIFNQWCTQGKCDFVCEGRLSIAVDTGHFFIDFLENGSDYYDSDELDSHMIKNYYFYSICYSDKKALIEFIKNTQFQEGSLLDNDFGKIERINELRKRNLDIFVE